MFDLRQTEQGVLVSVRALPGSSRNAVRGIHGGALKVAVTQAPEKGKANRALIKVLASALDLPESQIEIARGETSARKELLVRGVKLADLQERIRAAMDVS